MKILVYSDLHLEFGAFDPLTNDADVIVLTGERITPSLLANTLRGELVPQDPNDERAKGLLERVKQKVAGGKTSAHISSRAKSVRSSHGARRK